MGHEGPSFQRAENASLVSRRFDIKDAVDSPGPQHFLFQVLHFAKQSKTLNRQYARAIATSRGIPARASKRSC